MGKVLESWRAPNVASVGVELRLEFLAMKKKILTTSKSTKRGTNEGKEKEKKKK